MSNYNAYALNRNTRKEDALLTLSFEYLDWEDEYFFLHGLDRRYYINLFSTLDILQKSTVHAIQTQSHKVLIPKSIFNTNSGLHDCFSEHIIDSLKKKVLPQDDAEEVAKNALKNAFEIRTGGKNQGRIHGFLWNSTFYIVWFDPAHNLYYGKQPPKTCKSYAMVKGFSQESFSDMQEKLAKLEKDNQDLMDMLDNQTSPTRHD